MPVLLIVLHLKESQIGLKTMHVGGLQAQYLSDFATEVRF